MTDKTLSELIAQVVDRLVNQRLKEAPFDKSYSGVISEVLFDPDTEPDDVKFGQYKVRYGNAEKTIKLNDGLVHEIGERVAVHIFGNNPNRIYIEPTIKNITPYKIVYNDKEDTYIEHKKIKTNGKIYELESKYKLTVKNKDTDQEEVTELTLPNGEVISFEGWLV